MIIFVILFVFLVFTTNILKPTSRLKVLPTVVDGPWLVRASVGQVPTIIGKKLATTYVQGPDFLECSIDVFSSSAAKAVLGVCLNGARKMTMDVGFVVEAQTEEELPEEFIGGKIQISRIIIVCCIYMMLNGADADHL